MIGWLRHILTRPQRRSTSSNPAQWLIDWVSGGSTTSSGVSVNAAAALKFTPFWAAVRIISGTLAALPFKVYERLPGGAGKTPRPDHRLYALIHDRPNEYMDWVTFAETRQAQVLCYGNAYAEIQRDGGGRPVALWPLLPDRTRRLLLPDGTPYYQVRSLTGEQFNLQDANVLHIKGLGFDGYTGYDVVAYHKEAIGYGMAVKEYGSRFYGNDCTPSGVLEHPQHLGKEAIDILRKSIEANQQGLSRAHRFMILEEGLKWNKIGVDPATAQALDAQKFSVDDCARIFQIPPHKLGSMEFSKYNNVEQLQLDFLATTMLYWFRKWEQEISFKLLAPSERPRLFCEILVDGLLRGNVEARTKYYTAGRQWGFLSINDIRAKENMNPIGPAGDVYLDPLNMTPAGSLTAADAKPDATPAATTNDDNVDDGVPVDVQRAYCELLATQWQRIIKRVNANRAKRDTSNGFWAAERMWASGILSQTLQPWAALHRCPDSEAIIGEMVRSHIDADVTLTQDGVCAFQLACKMLERIRYHA